MTTLFSKIVTFVKWLKSFLIKEGPSLAAALGQFLAVLELLERLTTAMAKQSPEQAQEAQKIAEVIAQAANALAARVTVLAAQPADEEAA